MEYQRKDQQMLVGRTKPDRTEAAQFKNGVIDVTPFGADVLSMMVNNEGVLTVFTTNSINPDKWIEIAPGGWLLKYHGMYATYTDEVFHKLYEPVPAA